jgi:hypothetical protein
MSQDQTPKTKTETKRKQTVSVAERLVLFNKQHPNGCIRTEQVGMFGRPFYRATIIPDIANPARFFTGHAPVTAESRFLFRKITLLEGAEISAVAMALSLVMSYEMAYDSQRPHQSTKPGVCQECGRIWRKTDYDESGLLGTCPECRIKKRLFSRLKLL